ncbi:hypothetical protein [Streptomyces sp. bgisy104]|uniref:hypothetical protein n=1 Tax=Streptomyces sp. bgisy104 TaxID=3413785 RepID=UPI003EB7969C
MRTHSPVTRKPAPAIVPSRPLIRTTADAITDSGPPAPAGLSSVMGTFRSAAGLCWVESSS